MAYDNDEAGRTAAMNRQYDFGVSRVRIVEWPEGSKTQGSSSGSVTKGDAVNDTEPLVEPDAEAALAEIYRIKAEVAELEARRVELQDELAKHRLHGEQMLFLDDEGQQAHCADGDHQRGGGRRRRFASQVDEFAFEQVSTYKVSANKLAEAIETG